MADFTRFCICVCNRNFVFNEGERNTCYYLQSRFELRWGDTRVVLSSFIVAFCSILRMNELLVLPVEVIFPHVFLGSVLLLAELIL